MEHIKHLSLGWLVGAAALLFAGCSGEDGVIEEQTTEPTAQTQATIHVTVGAGITDGEATTRSTVDYTGGTRTLQFTTGDKLYVCGKASRSSYASGYEYYGYVLAGMLALDAIDPDDPTKATFSGDLSVYEALVDGDYDDEIGDWNVIYGVTYPDANRLDYLPYYISSDDPLSSCDYVRATLIHEGTESQATIDDYKDISLPTFDCAATVDELMTTGLIVTGNYDSGTKSFALTKDTDQPIVNCTISGLEAGVSYKVDYIYGTTAAMSDHSRKLFSSMEATGGTLAFAFIAQTGDKFHGIRLTNTADAGDTYTVSIGQKAFESKVYNLSRRFVNLASVTTETDGNGFKYFAAKNGQILTGNPSGKYDYLSIPDGATVTLNGVTFINGSIHCNGAATINLEGTNTIDIEWDFGIFIESGTLTIQGSGRLTATGGDDAAGIGGYDRANLVIKSGYITAQGGSSGAGIGSVLGNEFGTITIEGGTVVATGGEGGAGIGSGLDGSCGDITITGGNVTATGGDNAAGIGSGLAGGSCGDITITGGNVTATGGEGGAGIGSGQAGSSCGAIVIGSGITKVVATKTGTNSAHIGAGANGSSRTVTIDGVAGATTSSTFPHLTSTVDGNTWTLTKAN